jgi:hypothetical protein
MTEADFLAVQAMGLDAGQVAAVQARAAGDVPVNNAHAVGLYAADLAAALLGPDLLAVGRDLVASGRGKRLRRGRGGHGAERGRAQDQSEGGAFESHVAVPLIRFRLRGGPKPSPSPHKMSPAL